MHEFVDREVSVTRNFTSESNRDCVISAQNGRHAYFALTVSELRQLKAAIEDFFALKSGRGVRRE